MGLGEDCSKIGHVEIDERKNDRRWQGREDKQERGRRYRRKRNEQTNIQMGWGESENGLVIGLLAGAERLAFGRSAKQ